MGIFLLVASLLPCPFLLQVSVLSRLGARRGPAGGLPRAPDGTGRLAVVRPGRFKGRTAVFRQDGGPYRVRHVSAGQGDGRRGTAGGGTNDVS